MIVEGKGHDKQVQPADLNTIAILDAVAKTVKPVALP
jgi:hypothetical protein